MEKPQTQDSLHSEFPQLAELAKLKNDEVEKAFHIAQKMRNILIMSVKGTSTTFSAHDQAASELMKVMFNKFKTKAFDDLLNEMRDVQNSPIKPVMMYPEE